MNNKKLVPQGFTLVEILIAIAIIGIISSIAIPSYFSYVRKAKMAEGVVFMKAADFEVRNNVIKKGVPPTSIQGALDNDSHVVKTNSKNIDLIRYDGRGANKKWFVIRYPANIFPSGTGSRKRELHLVILKNSAGRWVTKCGQWSGEFMSEKYLPRGCNDTNIGRWNGLD